MNDLKQREIWVDNVKIFACILVVLGHFFQSMQTASILKGAVLDFFDQTIYYFHVPLFFICSGYLYQKLSKVNTFQSWWKNVLNKLIAFGFPYFFFSIVTWLIKNLFSSSVNTAVGGG